MSMVCDICGKGVMFGKHYCRRGLAKAKGGAGQKITGKSPRVFKPNVQKIRIITETGAIKRTRVCASCLKCGKVKKGATIKRKPAAA